jgi:hypothetical protein
MTSPVLSCTVRTSSVLSCLVLSCPVLYYTIQPCPILPCPVLYYPALSYHVVSYPALSYHVLSYPALSCSILSCPVLSRPIMPFCIPSWSILSCPVMSYPDLPYPVLSSLNKLSHWSGNMKNWTMGHLPGGSVVSVVVAVVSIRTDTYQMMSAQYQCRRRKSLMHIWTGKIAELTWMIQRMCLQIA